MLRLPRHAGDGEHAAAAERPEQAPAQVAEQGRIDRRGRRMGGGAGEEETDGEETA